MPDVPLPQEPPIELSECRLTRAQLWRVVGVDVEKLREVTGPSDRLNFAQVVRLAVYPVAVILFQQFVDILSVGRPHKLPDHLLGHIPADVLVVVTFGAYFFLLNFFEDVQSLPPLRLVPVLRLRLLGDNDVLLLLGHRGLPDKRPFGDVISVGEEFAEEGVR